LGTTFGRHSELGAFGTVGVRNWGRNRAVKTNRLVYLFAVETAGTWHDMAIELTQETGRRITAITDHIRETSFLL